MEKRLYEASVSGNVNTLNTLIQEDQLILDRVNITCFDETPLHIAALRGHLNFARALLIRKPELASELDSSRRSPLHLASVQGNATMVRELLRVRTDACFFSNEEGKIPLHLAAMKDRVDVVDELIRAQPESIKTRARRGETVLHLCVKHNRIEALKLLVELASQIDPDLLSSKDEDGNTIFHVAAALKQDETIRHLFKKEGMIAIANALNGNGFTALDLLESCLPRDLKAMEIRDLFVEAGVGRAKDGKNLQAPPPLPIIRHQTQMNKAWKKYLGKVGNWTENARGNLMVVAILTATMSFQAGINPPGGVWQDNKKGDEGHKAGTSILSKERHTTFVAFNTISFVASMSVILLVTNGFSMKNKLFIWLRMVAFIVAICFMSLTYFVSINMTTPDEDWGNGKDSPMSPSPSPSPFKPPFKSPPPSPMARELDAPLKSYYVWIAVPFTLVILLVTIHFFTWPVIKFFRFFKQWLLKINLQFKGNKWRNNCV